MLSSIVIDATHFGWEQPTGVELYVDALLPRLSRLLVAQGVSVFWIGHEKQAPAGTPEGVTWLSSPHIRFWSQRGLPATLKALKPDLYFTPSGLPPVLYKGPTALMVHDLSVYMEPASYKPNQRVRLGRLSRLAARQAKIITVPSRFTQVSLEKLWKVPVSKIVVTPLGYEPDEAQSEPIEGLQDEPFFIFLSRIERKKNLKVLIEGFAKLAVEQPVKLVLAGGDGFGAKAIRAQIAALPTPVRERIILPGYVSEGQKSWLFEHAAACVVPGYLEGFGLPVLVGFQYGLPVICAKAGSLPEVGADAALYAEPDIPTDWYLQMKNVLDKPELAHEYVSRGQARLKDFSWDATAELTAKALSNV